MKKNRIYYKLLPYIKKDKIPVVLSVVLLILGNLAVSIAPKKAGNVIDYLTSKANINFVFDTKKLVIMLLAIASLYIVGYIAQIISKYLLLKIARNTSNVMRSDIQRKLHKVPIRYLDSHPSGEIMSRLTNDMISGESLLEQELADMVAQYLIVIMVVGMMLYLDPILSLVYLILMPLCFYIMRFITAKTKKGFKKQQSAVGKLNGFIGNVIDNHSLVKMYNMENTLSEQFDCINKEFYSAYVKSKFASGFILPFSMITNNLGYILSSMIGAGLIIHQQITIGEFMAFLLYSQMLGGPLKQASSSLNQVQSGMAALERIFEFLEEEEEADESNLQSIDLSKVQGKIEFNEVNFGYTTDKMLFQKVNLETKPGSVIAIVGPSGAGKTTIINLLMRFYDIQSGTISLDGKNIATINRDELRKAFGMVLQDSFVFDGTIAENIAYGKENATREEIVKAATLVGCHTFIETMPDGYDTYIKEENSHISYGQKQMLVLARTVLVDPKILILDEATSNMDTRTENMITKAMNKMMKGKTTFIIAHRLFTIQNADMIIFMQDGTIKETGSHHELMKQNGLYAKMFHAMST